MKSVATIGALCAVASTALASPSTTTALAKRNTITPVYVSGNAFWAGDSRFYVRGVDYQPGGPDGPDPIADATTCKRDIALFNELGINTVRVYSVDNSKNHDECMNELAANGIYLALDVNNILYSINRDDPKPSYNAVYLQNVFATIDEFMNYPNTLLFFSGNEVINNAKNTNTAPYIKAVTRDMKNYIQARAPRQIPVGYSAADVTENREQTAEYMNCGSDGMARSDFFAFNDYSWCGNIGFQETDWPQKVQTYKDYSIPLFLSETGCNDPLPRHFNEISALYNPSEMTSVYSGGLIYQFTEESDNPNFGLVKISGGQANKLPDFTTLQQQLAKYPAPSDAGNYQANGSPSTCPPFSNMWEVKGQSLPIMPPGAQKYFNSGAGAGHGLKGDGSQTAGSGSPGWTVVSRPGASQTASPPVNAGSSSSGGSGNSAGSLRPAESRFGMIAAGVVVVASSLLGAAFL